MSKFSKNLLNIPNILTLIRVLIIPIFVFLMHIDQQFWAGVLFIFASVTDYFDGYLARKLNCESDFGKLMDPMADKILVMAALIMLVGQRHELTAQSLVPAWMVVVILTREVWVTSIRGLAGSRGIVISAGNSGKIKSFIQMWAISFIIYHSVVFFNISNFRVTAGFVGEQLLIISIVFSYLGAIDYTKKVFSHDG